MPETPPEPAPSRTSRTSRPPGSYRSAGELRVDDSSAGAYPVLEGGASIAWGTYTYRRVTAWDVLVPGLLRLTIR